MPDDASIFSHEYRRASTLSGVLNRALLMLKKRARGIKIADDEEEQARLEKIASAVMTALVEDLTDVSATRTVDRESIVLPAELIENLRRARGGDLAYFLDDLRQSSSTLAAGRADEKVLATLEAVTAAADIEASRVFRRMIRS